MHEAGSGSRHGEVYSHPFLYDLAFSYRDYAAECGFLCDAHARTAGKPLDRFLEIAAGPAGHAVELAARGVRCAALDLSAAMVQYGLERARARGVALDYWVADMTAFRAPHPYAMAACMLDSLSYLLEDAEIDAHLHRVADALDAQGVYLIELQHPTNPLDPPKTGSAWEIAAEHGRLQVRWEEERHTGHDSGRIVSFRALLAYEASEGRRQQVEASGLQRGFLPGEFAELVRKNGRFAVAQTLGGLSLDLPLSDPKAWRMVFILQKV